MRYEPPKHLPISTFSNLLIVSGLTMIVLLIILLIVNDTKNMKLAKASVEIDVLDNSNQNNTDILGVFDNKEISTNQYQMVLKKQKDLNSTYFNQQMVKVMDDQIITSIEYAQINSIYKQIIETRKELSKDTYISENFSNEDRLKSIKKEIKMHSLSQNDNLI